MKRHESIAPLSRDHHFALLFCWKLRQGLKKQVPTERIQPFVQYFWENHLEGHFEEEESIVFAELKDSLCDQAISEHRNLRHLVKAMNGTGSIRPEEINFLADSLDKHIRFEERTLFPHIENSLPDAVLIAIGNRLQQSHQSHENDSYPDDFWT
jgi:hemerythrin-like domain-containing protein